MNDKQLLEWLEEPVKLELQEIGVEYTEEKVQMIINQTNFFYKNPDAMINFNENQRTFYEKFINILSEKIELQKKSNISQKMQYIPQENSNKNGFLNIIFLSLLTLMLIMIIIYIIS